MSWYAKNARLVCALLNRRSRRDPHRESVARRKRLSRKFRAILTLLCMSYREGGKVKKRALSKITKLPPEMVEKIHAFLRGAILADAPGGRPP